MMFNPVSQSVLLATEQLYSLPLVVVGGIPTVNKIYTHRHSITTLNYSSAFGLVISTSSGSVSSTHTSHTHHTRHTHHTHITHITHTHTHHTHRVEPLDK